MSWEYWRGTFCCKIVSSKLKGQLVLRLVVLERGTLLKQDKDFNTKTTSLRCQRETMCM